ncbi:sensor histidine kinase [Spirosoma endbachense]|uniref:Uncharacterized protein n=1 Tax=Spirosoma endbachense TaxID=2666025 RepID=A0A6P1W870_9BACT|nr:hypothetical protein [Spirosoma endbachense]QHW00111.1 hypothetical protein GJR95_36090 [Spirosoma endbachense]
MLVRSLGFEYKQEQLRVLIGDNGKGFDQTLLSLRTGQTSMQQRADAIVAQLRVRSEPCQGAPLQLVVNT